MPTITFCLVKLQVKFLILFAFDSISTFNLDLFGYWLLIQALSMLPTPPYAKKKPEILEFNLSFKHSGCYSWLKIKWMEKIYSHRCLETCFMAMPNMLVIQSNYHIDSLACIKLSLFWERTFETPRYCNDFSAPALALNSLFPFSCHHLK